MKSTFVHFATLTAVLAVLLPYTPWWAIFILPMLFGFIWHRSARMTMLISFGCAFIVWSIFSYFIGYQNEFALANGIGKLFGGIPAKALPFVTGFIGAAYAGFGGYLGQAIKNRLSKKPIR